MLITIHSFLWKVSHYQTKHEFQVDWISEIQKKYKDAQSHFEKAINIKNDYSKAHFHLAMLLKEIA